MRLFVLDAVYPSHLRSVVNSFDGIMPAERLGELPAGDQLRLFQLNGLPNRPCTARFSLPDNSVDARMILEQIMDTGVQRNHILCIQRLRTGMVEVTFARKEDCDLFLSRAGIPSGQRPFTFSRSSKSSTIFVTVRDAPWELSEKLIADRLEQYGTVISIRCAYNQSLLPEKVCATHGPPSRYTIIYQIWSFPSPGVLPGTAQALLEVLLARSHRSRMPISILF